MYILSLDVNEKLKTIYISMACGCKWFFKFLVFKIFKKNRQTIGSEIEHFCESESVLSRLRLLVYYVIEMNKENIIPHLIPALIPNP